MSLETSGEIFTDLFVQGVAAATQLNETRCRASGLVGRYLEYSLEHGDELYPLSVHPDAGELYRELQAEQAILAQSSRKSSREVLEIQSELVERFTGKIATVSGLVAHHYNLPKVVTTKNGVPKRTPIFRSGGKEDIQRLKGRFIDADMFNNTAYFDGVRSLERRSNISYRIGIVNPITLEPLVRITFDK